MGAATRRMTSVPAPYAHSSGSRLAAIVAMVMIFDRRRMHGPLGVRGHGKPRLLSRDEEVSRVGFEPTTLCLKGASA